MPYTEDRAAWYEGQGLWQHVPQSDWNDWVWQLKNRITSVEQLERLMTLTEDEKIGCAHANQKLALAITPYFFNLIDRSDPDFAVRMTRLHQPLAATFRSFGLDEAQTRSAHQIFGATINGLVNTGGADELDRAVALFVVALSTQRWPEANSQ